MMRRRDSITSIFIDFHWFLSIFVNFSVWLVDRPTNEGTDEGTQPLLSRCENASKQGQIGSVKWTDDQRFMSKREGANVLKYIYIQYYLTLVSTDIPTTLIYWTRCSGPNFFRLCSVKFPHYTGLRYTGYFIIPVIFFGPEELFTSI